MTLAYADRSLEVASTASLREEERESIRGTRTADADRANSRIYLVDEPNVLVYSRRSSSTLICDSPWRDR